VIARAYNLTETLNDATAHAEMQAITMATSTIGGKYLDKCTLYVTVEPCPMCATAISMMRIKRLVFGSQNPKGGAVLNGIKFYESATCFHKPEITSGILEDKTSKILKDFFKSKRQTKNI
jgi:tRNA(Arg) A34 adenosine deaminase TadA